MSGAARVTAHDTPTLSIYQGTETSLHDYECLDLATKLAGQFAQIYPLTHHEWLALSEKERLELEPHTRRMRNGVRVVIRLT